jgi:hypothetical protein
MVEEFFFDGVAVEPGNGRQAPGDGGPGPAERFEVAGGAFDVGAPGAEQADVVLLAYWRRSSSYAWRVRPL